MLAKASVTPMLAVRDIDRARDFYRKLGFDSREEMGGDIATLTGGESDITLYRSQYAGTNKATALTFEVADIEAEVDELRGSGIGFEHYDVDGLVADGDIYVGEGMRTAWFKDPDGNILSLFEGTPA